jgi:hypothetical protein
MPCPCHPCTLSHASPNNMLIVTSLFKPDTTVGGSTNEGRSAGGKVASDVVAGGSMATLAAVGYVVSDVAAGSNVVTSKRVPLMMIGGRVWSPGVYQALQVLGHPLDVAWKRAFFLSHFYSIISVY